MDSMKGLKLVQKSTIFVCIGSFDQKSWIWIRNEAVDQARRAGVSEYDGNRPRVQLTANRAFPSTTINEVTTRRLLSTDYRKSLINFERVTLNQQVICLQQE